jgi:hypothetical protein
MRKSLSKRTRLKLERLEERRCFNVDLSVAGGTLTITGDNADNHVAVMETAAGLSVQVEDQAARPFTGIENIVFDGRQGNDLFTFKWDMRRGINLRALLGDGNDTFRADVNSVSDSGLPPGPCRIFVSGGAGNDDINALIGLLRNERPSTELGNVDFNFEGGDGNDRTGVTWGLNVGLNVYGKLGAGDDSFQSKIFGNSRGGAPSASCRMAIFGEGGNDNINALIGLLDVSPQVIQNTLNIGFDGGEGNDTINVSLNNVQLDGSTSIRSMGGAGDDMLIALLNKASETNLFEFSQDGGAGNDVLSLIAPGAGDGVPAPPVNFDVFGTARIRMDGGLGNDRVIGQIVPCVRPNANLDLVFAGGDGEDIVTMLIQQEHITPNEGILNASVLGGAGSDLLALIVKNQTERATNRRYLIDGGEGFDSYYAGALVPAVNVEKKL